MKTNKNYEFTALCITYYTISSKYYRGGHDAGDLKRLFNSLPIYIRGVFSFISNLLIFYFRYVILGNESQEYKAAVL